MQKKKKSCPTNISSTQNIKHLSDALDTISTFLDV